MTMTELKITAHYLEKIPVSIWHTSQTFLLEETVQSAGPNRPDSISRTYSQVACGNSAPALTP